MAELTKPNFNIQRQIQQVRPGTERAIGPSQVPNTYNVASDAFSKLIDVLDQHQALKLQSQKTADRLQASQIIREKTAHHNDLLTKLKLHLNETAPEHLNYKDTFQKLRTRDIDGRTEFNIGKDLDINISPKSLPDGLSQDVLDLVEDHYINLDQDLLSKILEGVETASSNYDTQLMTLEAKNARSQIKSSFARQQTNRHEALKGAREPLDKLVYRIKQRATEGGTLDQFEVQIEIDKGMQAYLEEYYYYDMNSSDMTADEVTKKAEKGLYQIEYDGETYVLSPNFYQQDITKRYNRFDTERRHSDEQERIQEINDNFAKYKYTYSADKGRLPGADTALKEIHELGVNVDEALAWVTQQDAIGKQKGLIDLEEELNSEIIWNKGNLIKFSKPVTDKNGKAIKDEYGNIKRTPLKGDKLVEALKRQYRDKYSEEIYKSLSEGVISRLISTHLQLDRRADKIERTKNQDSLVLELSNRASNPYGSGTILERFGYFDDLGEWAIDSGKVAQDGKLKDIFGEGNQAQKMLAIAQLFNTAKNVHKRHLDKQAKEAETIDDNTANAIIDTIANEYVRNAQARFPAALKKQAIPDWQSRRGGSNKKRTTQQLAKEMAVEDSLKGLMVIGENVINRSISQLNKDLEILDKEYNEYGVFTGNLKNIVEKAIKDRMSNLTAYTGTLALEETGQKEQYDKGEEIDVEKLYA